MLTECPSCATVFRVTGAILKIGHGQVRCGKCRTQFDALESLLDEEQLHADPTDDSDAAESQENQPNEDSAIIATEPDVAEEITLEGSRIEISGTYRVPPDVASSDSDHAQTQIIHGHMVIDRDQPGSDAESDADKSADANSSDPYLSDEDEIIEISVDDGEPVAAAAEHLLADVAPEAKEPKPLAARLWNRNKNSEPAKPIEQPIFANPEIDAELAALSQPQVQERRGPGWTIASIVLGFVLVAQVIHHNRNTLVRHATYGGALSNVYRTFGIDLTPWDLKDYELQQWGVVSDNAGRDALRVRASVTNAASFAQPYPFIKLALEDRYGAPVAMREFSPAEYLPSTAIANRMMAPRQRTNADIVIVDPGVDAVGFQLHACLPREGTVICSDDLVANK